MKIAVMTDVLDEQSSGMASALDALLGALLGMDNENEYLLVHQRPSGNPLYKKARELIVPLPYMPPKNTLRKNILLPRLLEREGVDIVHDPTQTAPIMVKTKCPRVMTVHDVIPLSYPENGGLAQAYHRLSLSRSCELAGRVITCSNHSKGEICRQLSVPHEKVSVVYNALKPVWAPKEDPQVTEHYNLKNYILYVGGYDRRKNLPALLAAFKRLLIKQPDLKLALAGPLTHDYPQVRQKAEELGISKSVVHAGDVSLPDLQALYASASLFILPSLYEGFGLPALEAMACGTPVIASNAAALPEIVGDAGLLADARDETALAGAMQQVLSDDSLRKKLVEKGFERSKEFTPKKAAEQTLAIYREVAHGPD